MTKTEEIQSQAQQWVTRPIHFQLHLITSPERNCNNASFFNKEDNQNSTCVSTILEEKKRGKKMWDFI